MFFSRQRRRKRTTTEDGRSAKDVVNDVSEPPSSSPPWLSLKQLSFFLAFFRHISSLFPSLPPKATREDGTRERELRRKKASREPYWLWLSNGDRIECLPLRIIVTMFRNERSGRERGSRRRRRGKRMLRVSKLRGCVGDLIWYIHRTAVNGTVSSYYMIYSMIALAFSSDRVDSNGTWAKRSVSPIMNDAGVHWKREKE